MAYVIGVDVGGTFTDAVLDDNEGTLIAAKSPSSPPDYSVGVVDALDALAGQLDLSLEDMLADTHHIAHGTTSSLNALVTGNVPAVGFLTTAGHRDSLYIMNVEGRYLGRSPDQLQNVMGQTKTHALLPKKRALEVIERIDRDGNVVVPLNEDAARDAIRALVADGVAAIAVSLLWSFRNPVHERRLRELVHEIDPVVFVSLSSEVSPRIREFSRSATTIMSAQIGPGLRDYLGELETKLRDHKLAGPLLVMQSNGGAIAAAEAPRGAISTVGSVLTGGVVGALSLGRQLGHRNIIATDVGGTTFLAGLIVDGEPVRATTTIINHHPINVPSLEVHAIGSGGGAIAWVDPGGNLHIGPRSAQAVPGPACYGQGGTEPTNTDANLVLGILPESGLLGGKKKLSMELAREAIRTRIAEPLGLSVEDAASAIYAVQNAQTGDLLRKTVVEAGHDPRNFIVYAFGGSGPAHCAGYAAEVGVKQVVVPLGQVASAFSAYGLASSDVVLATELSVPSAIPLDPEKVRKSFEELEAQVREALARQGLSFTSIGIEREIDMRFTAQLAEIAVPVAGDAMDQPGLDAAATWFERKYAELYGEGTGFRGAGIQAITFRVRATGVLPFSPELPGIGVAGSSDASAARTGTRPVCLDGATGYVDTGVYDYRKLARGHVIPGPAIIEVPTTTVVVPHGATGTIDHLGNLTIAASQEQPR
ncbi:hydantoinase/oxoprolinase family protein [Amycolatopsis alkalitolerans]|uniref:Hydantoinase/oxoprolinase family protein n=1 Tax=Amycolatopsis alkalitolerans TaxID=2547244 RepID=A0A5C4M7D8_9PSEU|nr:hydantoinase/oxoprolinase family protein [Amycolatopsis alkalitolerans]TNC29194.1 hydantoinase/oxoprolinase family protein [Amycolatopsis alkalitolerans]